MDTSATSFCGYIATLDWERMGGKGRKGCEKGNGSALSLIG